MLHHTAIGALEGTAAKERCAAWLVCSTTSMPTSDVESNVVANTCSVAALLPIMGVVLIAFLVIGLALPVLPLHVHQGLGLSPFIVGLVTGSQFVASLLSRIYSGRYADTRGAKRAVVAGLLTAVAGGLLYLASIPFAGAPSLSAAILLGGRALLGAAESFVITGAVSWGLALGGRANTGRVIAWIGMAMFASLAFGAPLGVTLYANGGFIAVAVMTMVLPLLAVLTVAWLPSIPAQQSSPTGLMRVLSQVWLPGIGAAFSTVGFGAMIAFSSLLSTERAMEPRLADVQRIRGGLGGNTTFFRPRARQAGRRKGRVHLCVHRSGRSCDDLVCFRRLHGRGRRRTDRHWLFADLSGLRRRSGPVHVAEKPRPRHGGLHCVS